MSVLCLVKPGEKVERLLEQRDMSISRLAKKIGKSRQSVHSWITGVSVPRTESEWQSIADVFGLSLEDLLDPRKDPTIIEPATEILSRPLIPVGFKYIKLPFAGNVPAGEWGDPLASDEFIELENANFEHPRRFAAYVVGDSCFPALQQGDLTIWHADTAPPYRTIVLAQRKGDHGCTVKEMLYDQERGRVILHPINERYDEPADGDGWGVIARLVGVVRERDGMKQTFYRPEGLAKKHF